MACIFYKMPYVFLECPERGEKHGVILENKMDLMFLKIFSVFFFF